MKSDLLAQTGFSASRCRRDCEAERESELNSAPRTAPLQSAATLGTLCCEGGGEEEEGEEESRLRCSLFTILTGGETGGGFQLESVQLTSVKELGVD